jgi:hypothetical protein
MTGGNWLESLKAGDDVLIRHSSGAGHTGIDGRIGHVVAVGKLYVDVKRGASVTRFRRSDGYQWGTDLRSGGYFGFAHIAPKT